MRGKDYAELRRWLAAGSGKNDSHYVLTRGQIFTDGDKSYSISGNGYVMHVVEAALPALPNGMIPFAHSSAQSFDREFPDMLAVFQKCCAAPKKASITFNHQRMVAVLQSVLNTVCTESRSETPVVLEMLPETGAGGEEVLYIYNAAKAEMSFRYRIAASPSSDFKLMLNACYLYAALKPLHLPEIRGGARIRLDVPSQPKDSRELPVIVRVDHYSPTPQIALIMPIQFAK